MQRGPLSEGALARARRSARDLDTDPAALAELHKTAQGVLRRLTAKGVARAVADWEGA